MGVSVVPAAFTFFFSLLLAYLVYRRRIDASVTQAFLLMAVFLAAWAFVAIFALTTQDKEHFAQLYSFGSVFQVLHFGAFLHLVLAVTGRIPRKKRYLYALYFPCIFTAFLFLLHSDYASGFELVDGAWHFNHPYDTPAFFGMAGIWFGYYGPAAYLLFSRARFTLTARERKLFRILGTSVVALILVTTLEVLVAPLVFGIPSRGNLIGFKFVWLLGIAFVVDRFQFLSAPGDLDEIALSLLPGYAVIVLDRDQKVHSANDEARRYLSLPRDHGGRFSLPSLLPGNEALYREIAALAVHDHDSVSCVVSVPRNGSTPELLDLRVSMIRDAYDAHLGYLLLGSESEGIRNIELIGRLSWREIEIVQEVMQGRRNAEIAQRLFISERTVKTHLTHIFTKLGVESRLELYALLKDANVVSRHRAEKKLLLLRSDGDPNHPA